MGRSDEKGVVFLFSVRLWALMRGFSGTDGWFVCAGLGWLWDVHDDVE